MSFIDNFGILVRSVFNSLGNIYIKKASNIFKQVTLILFHSKKIVAATFYNRFCNLGLGSNRINGHDAACDVQQLQQFRDSGNLIGFVCDFGLTQDKFVLGRPSTHHIDRRFPSILIVRTS